MKKTTPSPDKPSTSDLLQSLQATQSNGTTRQGEAVLFSSATWTPANRDNQAFYKQMQKVCLSFQPGTVYELETALPGLIKQIVRAIISSGSSREKLLSPSLRNGAFDESCAIQRLSDSLSQLSVHQLIAIEQRAPGTILTLAQCAAAKTGSPRPLDALSETLLALTDWEAFTPENTLNTMIWLIKASQQDPNCPHKHAITLHACSLLPRDHFNSLVEKMPDLILMLFELAQHDRPAFIPARTTAEDLLARVFTAYTDLGHAKWVRLQQKSPGMMNSILSYLLYVEDASSSYNSGVTFVESYLQASTGDALILLGKNHPNTLTSLAKMAKREISTLTRLTHALGSLPSQDLLCLQKYNAEFFNYLTQAAVYHKMKDPISWIKDQLDTLVTDLPTDFDETTKHHEQQPLTACEPSTIHRTNPEVVTTIQTLTLVLYRNDIPLYPIEEKSPGFLKILTSPSASPDSLTMLGVCIVVLSTVNHNDVKTLLQRAPSTIHAILERILYYFDMPADVDAAIIDQDLPLIMAKLLAKLAVMFREYQDFHRIGTLSPGTFTALSKTAKHYPAILDILIHSLPNLDPNELTDLELKNPGFLQHFVDAARHHQHADAMAWVAAQLSGLKKFLNIEKNAPGTMMHLFTAAGSSEGKRLLPVLADFLKAQQGSLTLHATEKGAPGTIQSIAAITKTHRHPDAYRILTELSRLLTRLPFLGHARKIEQRAPGTIKQFAQAVRIDDDDILASISTEELGTWAYQAPIDAMTHPDLLGQLSYDDWLEIERNTPGTIRKIAYCATLGYPSALQQLVSKLADVPSDTLCKTLLSLERKAPKTIKNLLYNAFKKGDLATSIVALFARVGHDFTAENLLTIETYAPGTMMHLFTAARSSEGKRLLPVLAGILQAQQGSIKLYAIEKAAPGTIKSIAAMSTEELGTRAYQAPIDAMTHPDLLGQLSYDDWLEIERNTPGTIRKIAYCATLGYPSALQQLVSKLADAPSDTLCKMLLSLERKAPKTIKNLLHNAFKKGDLATSILTLFARVGYDFTAENLFTIETDAPGTLASLAHASMRHNPSAFWAITPKLAQLNPEQLYPLICHPQAPETLRKLVQSLNENQSDFALKLALCIDECLSPNEVFTLETSLFSKGTVATLANSAMSNNFPVLWEALANKLLQLSPEDLQAVEGGHANTLSSIRDAAEHFHEHPVSGRILNQFSQLLPQPAVNLAGPAADAIRFFGPTPFDMEDLEDHSQPASSHSP